MKKILVLLSLVFCFWQAGAQTFVVTQPQQRNAVLEEYTGIHCGWCPEGHRISEALKNEFGDRYVAINIHQGGYATPDTTKGEPDFRTIFGDSLAAQAGVTGYPTGTVNRHIFPDIDANNTAMSRSAWRLAATKVMDMYSPVNVGFRSSFDTAGRELTIDVEVYYSGNSDKNINYLNIALLENHVTGYQSDYVQGNTNTYDHKNILRHFITGQWGDKIKTTTEGTLFSKTYHYTVSADWNINNCNVVVYVAESRQEIYTGVSSTAVNGYSNGQGGLFVGDFIKPAQMIKKATSGNKTTYNFSALSRLSGNNDFVFRLTSDQPANWNAGFIIDSKTYTDSAIVQMTSGGTQNISLEVTPGNSPALATFKLEMYAVSNPTSVKTATFYVISGITDLVINNSAPWGTATEDTNASLFQQYFLDGLEYAGNSSYGATTSKIALEAASYNLLDEVKYIYYNVGWSFPSLTDDLVTYFKSVLDNGGNLMLSGQDIGWDNWDAGGYGNDNTKNFIIDYMKASFVDDGSTSNNQLTNANDELYKDVAKSAIVNMYGEDNTGTRFMYPDQLKVENQGKPVFYYNTVKSRVAAVRSNVYDYKTFYMGVSLEMLADDAVRKEIMKITHDWFHGKINTDVFDQKMAVLMQPYPNPAANQVAIPVPDEGTCTIEVYNSNGQEVLQYKGVASKRKNLDISTLDEGIYFYRLTQNGIVREGRFAVSR